MNHNSSERGNEKLEEFPSKISFLKYHWISNDEHADHSLSLWPFLFLLSSLIDFYLSLGPEFYHFELPKLVFVVLPCSVQCTFEFDF